MENNIFYTYCYLDPRKPGNFNYGPYHFDFEPMYIGKGNDYRMEIHMRDTVTKDHFHNKLRKIVKLGLDPIRYKLFENVDETTSFSREKELIAIIGRFDLKKGPLLNLTEGGEGVSGRVVSPATRKKMSEAKKGKPLSELHRKHIAEVQIGRKQTEATKQKRSESLKGRIITPEHAKKIAEGRRGKLHSEVTKKHLSEIQIGRKQTEATKKKRSETMKGRPLSEAHKRAVKEASKEKGKGRKLSASHKKAISENSYMHGRTLKSIWTEKYGPEEAERRDAQRIQRFKETFAKNLEKKKALKQQNSTLQNPGNN